MSVLDFYYRFKERFPAITLKADKEYFDYWGEFENDELSAHVWFESLANALNKEMGKRISAETHRELFEFISNQFLCGSEGVQKCIDVAFTENLFWNVVPEKIEPYWQLLPDVLKKLYIGFHGRKPASLSE